MENQKGLKHWIMPLILFSMTAWSSAQATQALAVQFGASMGTRARLAQCGALMPILVRIMTATIDAAARLHDALRDEIYRIGTRLENHPHQMPLLLPPS